MSHKERAPTTSRDDGWGQVLAGHYGGVGGARLLYAVAKEAVGRRAGVATHSAGGRSVLDPARAHSADLCVI